MILERPEEPGKKFALAFTVMVHAGLIAALFFGVQWKRSQPDVMEVELWSSRPMPATQVLPPPPPKPEVIPEPPKPLPKAVPKPEPLPVKKPDIVIKEEKKPPKVEPKKSEPRPEPPKPEPKKPEPKPEVKPKVDPFKEALEREERQRKDSEMRDRLSAQADAEQRASSSRRGLEAYATKIRNKIRGNITLPPNIQGNPEAIFELKQLPSGEVLAVKLKRSSGNLGLDAAIERAILKSSPLPKPDDLALFQRELTINYKPFAE
ncbi:MAG: protein TolA [Betaproteobacteria bacterium HGW-Betaproteobacteria-10]|nr:MAG: protein TolA [Betaproteobacteria bacterium HGW-Betaproteobacteria-10]